ncbi:hypothetical protein R6Q57_006104 [Mikania cordata]
MALYLTPLQPPLVVRASAATSASSSGNRKPDPQRKSWWTPLFGWSSDPDYIDSHKNSTNTTSLSDSDPDQRTVRSRVSPANFTDEKARKLRMMTMETESFHDAMYHSAIASRLASDFSDRSDR